MLECVLKVSDANESGAIRMPGRLWLRGLAQKLERLKVHEQWCPMHCLAGKPKLRYILFACIVSQAIAMGVCINGNVASRTEVMRKKGQTRRQFSG